MKIEFIKEERIDGTMVFYTKADGSYVDSSIEFTEEKGRVKYEFVVRTKSTKPIETVLESAEI
jgi:hypothetical protein